MEDLGDCQDAAEDYALLVSGGFQALLERLDMHGDGSDVEDSGSEPEDATSSHACALVSNI